LEDKQAMEESKWQWAWRVPTWRLQASPFPNLEFLEPTAEVSRLGSSKLAEVSFGSMNKVPDLFHSSLAMEGAGGG
jgi:hypothetical protein